MAMTRKEFLAQATLLFLKACRDKYRCKNDRKNLQIEIGSERLHKFYA